jgi:hypothetical protein
LYLLCLLLLLSAFPHGTISPSLLEQLRPCSAQRTPCISVVIGQTIRLWVWLHDSSSRNTEHCVIFVVNPFRIVFTAEGAA